MVETVIYVLIGALSAALLFLLALPAISYRALRLARARASLTAPLSALEARADRDALRAKHAVEVALVERRAEEAQARWDSAQIALGRQAADIVARDTDIAEKQAELARRAAEIAQLTTELRARDTEIGAREVALLDLTGQREAAERRATEAAERLKAGLLKFDAAQADLEGRIAALSRELSEARRDADAAQSAASARIADLTRRLAESEAAAERLKDEAAAPRAAFSERDERERLAREVKDLGEKLAASESRAEALSEGDAALRQAIARLGRELAAKREPASTL